MNSRLFRFDFDRTHFGDHGLESSTISCPATPSTLRFALKRYGWVASSCLANSLRARRCG